MHFTTYHYSNTLFLYYWSGACISEHLLSNHLQINLTRSTTLALGDTSQLGEGILMTGFKTDVSMHVCVQFRHKKEGKYTRPHVHLATEGHKDKGNHLKVLPPVQLWSLWTLK